MRKKDDAEKRCAAERMILMSRADVKRGLPCSGSCCGWGLEPKGLGGEEEMVQVDGDEAGRGRVR